MKPVQLLGILLLLAALCGCGGERRDPSDLGEILTEYGNDTAAEKGDWLMLQMPAEMPHLNPLTTLIIMPPRCWTGCLTPCSTATR